MSRAQRAPSVPPTLPDPMTAMFMVNPWNAGPPALRLLVVFIHPLDDAVRRKRENRNRRDHDEEDQQQED
jgi:hypothetical protein